MTTREMSRTPKGVRNVLTLAAINMPPLGGVRVFTLESLLDLRRRPDFTPFNLKRQVSKLTLVVFDKHIEEPSACGREESCFARGEHLPLLAVLAHLQHQLVTLTCNVSRCCTLIWRAILTHIRIENLRVHLHRSRRWNQIRDVKLCHVHRDLFRIGVVTIGQHNY